MSEISPTVMRAVLLAHGYLMRADFQATVGSTHGIRTGKLSRAFKEKVMSRGGDIEGLSFLLPRYGYILNHGVKSQSVKRESGSYSTKGFKGSGYINNVLDRHAGKIADDVAAIYGKEVAERIRF